MNQVPIKGVLLLLLLVTTWFYLVLLGDVAIGTDEDAHDSSVSVTGARVHRCVTIL